MKLLQVDPVKSPPIEEVDRAHAVITVVDNKIIVTKNREGPHTEDLLGDFNRLMTIRGQVTHLLEEAIHKEWARPACAAYRKVLKVFEEAMKT